MLRKRQVSSSSSRLFTDSRLYKWITDRWDTILTPLNCKEVRVPYFDSSETVGKDVETPDRHPIQISDHLSHTMRFRMSNSAISHILNNINKKNLPTKVCTFGPIFYRDETSHLKKSEKFTYLNLGNSNLQTMVETINVLNSLLTDIGLKGYSIRLNDLSVVNAILDSLQVDPFLRNIFLFHLHEIKELKDRKSFKKYLEQKFGLRLDKDFKSGDSLPSSRELSVAMNLVLSEMELPTHRSRDREEIVGNVLKKFERKKSLRILLDKFEDIRPYLRSTATISDARSLEKLKKAGSTIGVSDRVNKFLGFTEMVSRLPGFSGSLCLDPSLSAWSIFYDNTIFRIDLPGEKKESIVFGLGGSSDTACGAVVPGSNLPTSGFTLDMDTLVNHLASGKNDGVYKKSVKSNLDPGFLIIPLDPSQLMYSFEVADHLKKAGIAGQIDSSGAPLQNSLKKAAGLGVKKAILVGEGEERDKTVTLRDMKTQRQRTISISQLKKL